MTERQWLSVTFNRTHRALPFTIRAGYAGPLAARNPSCIRRFSSVHTHPTGRQANPHRPAPSPQKTGREDANRRKTCGTLPHKRLLSSGSRTRRWPPIGVKMSEDAMGFFLLFGATGLLIGEYGFGHALAGLAIGSAIGAIAALLAHSFSRKRSDTAFDRSVMS